MDAAIAIDAARSDAGPPLVDAGPACDPSTRLPGDADCSGCVDEADHDLVLAEYGSPIPPGDARADLNDDGIVDIADRMQVLIHWGRGCAAPP